MNLLTKIFNRKPITLDHALDGVELVVPETICRIVCDRIWYSGKQDSDDPYEVWAKRRANCIGFAAVVFHLCKKAGFSCELRRAYRADIEPPGHDYVVGSCWFSSNGTYFKLTDRPGLVDHVCSVIRHHKYHEIVRKTTDS